jgi:hypothetical protein
VANPNRHAVDLELDQSRTGLNLAPPQSPDGSAISEGRVKMHEIDVSSSDRVSNLFVMDLQRLFALAVYLLCVCGTGLAILAKAATFSATKDRPFLLVGIGFVVVAMLCAPFAIRFGRRYIVYVSSLVLIGIIVFLTIIAPRFAALHEAGRGTDQGDCVVIAASRLASGLWPYDSIHMWSHNPMSCGPAWVVFQ